jgi:glycosyltransferase involved in cell wall biosynthesis
MAEVAKAIDRSRFQPHVLCLRPTGMRAEELRAAGVPILHLPIGSFASVGALTGAYRLLRYIRDHRIRLVHSFDVPLNIFTVPVAKLARRPIVLSSQRASRSLTPGLYHRLLRVTDRLVDGIVVNCEYLRKELIDEEQVPARLIHLCYNGIDTSIFGPGDAPVHPGLEDASLVIGVVCALRPEKGLLTLVDAFARIAPKHAGVKLAIVGSGPELGALQARGGELGVLDSIVFAPATSQVAPWLRAMDIFVLPSLSEALSNSLMEAMACKCCPVASRVGGNPELVGDLERGLLFEPGDAGGLAEALEKLIVDSELRRSLAQTAREFIRSGFALSSSVQCMQQLYAAFLESAGTYLRP